MGGACVCVPAVPGRAARRRVSFRFLVFMHVSVKKKSQPSLCCFCFVVARTRGGRAGLAFPFFLLPPQSWHGPSLPRHGTEKPGPEPARASLLVRTGAHEHAPASGRWDGRANREAPTLTLPRAHATHTKYRPAAPPHLPMIWCGGGRWEAMGVSAGRGPGVRANRQGRLKKKTDRKSAHRAPSLSPPSPHFADDVQAGHASDVDERHDDDRDLGMGVGGWVVCERAEARAGGECRAPRAALSLPPFSCSPATASAPASRRCRS